MVRFILLAVAAMLLSGCASHGRVLTQAEMQANRIAAAPLVEAALASDMTALYTRAQTGTPRDRLIFALAVGAGRDTSSLPDPAATPANMARAEALEAQDYGRWTPLGDTPSQEDVEAWAVMTRRHLFICLPCQPERAPEGDGDASYAAWIRLNTPNYPGWAPDQVARFALGSASFCMGAISFSLKLEAALKWLDRDQLTATGRRVQLNRALYEELDQIYQNEDGHTCLEGRFGIWRELLRSQRPELEAQAAAFLEQRLGDPRDPRRRM